MKKKKIILICCLVFTIFISSQNVLADDYYEGEAFVDTLSDYIDNASAAQPPKIDAGAAIVMDMKTGRVLYEKNAYTRKAMASTTKIMTAIVTIENGNLEDSVTVSKRAAGTGGSSIGLQAGETLKLRELLYGLLLNSGNDASIAIAEHIGGSVENFVDMMNKKAEELGAKDTAFKTPHGLDANGHYSTAYDLALITKYALDNPTFSKIVGTTSTTISIGGLYNTNEMLGLYPGADGVKTGYTGKAGRCLVTSATRGGWRIISVVLNCNTRYVRAQSSKDILDYAFNSYKNCQLIKQDENVARIPVTRGVASDVLIKAVDEINIPLRSDEEYVLETEVDLPDSFKSPVSAGIEVGNIKYIVNGKVIAQSPLKTGEEVRKKGILDYLGQIIRDWGRTMRTDY